MDRVRRAMAIVLVVIASALSIAIPLVCEALLPWFDTVGGVKGALWHLLLAIPVMLFLLATATAVVLVARKLWDHAGLVIGIMYAAIYSPFAGWRVVSTANVVLDPAPAEVHEVKLVGWTTPRKGPSTIEVSSWKDPSIVLSIEGYAREDQRVKGTRVRLVTHGGALGIPYVTEARILGPSP